ncbi:MAG: DarT ssDNA thymidine ADP-ribosyltransferase family protein [bacterium]
MIPLNEIAPPVKKRKSDWEKFLDIISRRNLSQIYHYTPIENLPRILTAQGMYSRHQARLRNIHPVETHGWGNKFYDLEDYICLSFVPPKWLLEKGAGRFAALAVNPRVIGYQGTIFSRRSSASIEVNTLVLKATDTADEFDVLFPDADGMIPKYPLSEILVEDYIPLRDIQAIYLPTWKGNHGYFWFWLYKKWSNFYRYGFSYPPLLVDAKKKLF